MLIAVEIKRAHDVLDPAERGFDLPAAPVDLTDHFRRELIPREVSDKQLKISVAKINADETKIDIVIVRFIKEVKRIPVDDLKIRDVSISFAVMEGESSVEGQIKLSIRKLIA